MILAGRRINDGVGQRIARECVRRLLRRKNGAAATVTVLGMTFKENVPDARNSKVADIVSELESFGVTVQVHDPLADPREVKQEYGIELAAMDALSPANFSRGARCFHQRRLAICDALIEGERRHRARREINARSAPTAS